MTRKLLIILAMLLMAASCTVSDEPAADSNQSESQPLNQAELDNYQKLVERLIVPMFSYGPYGEQQDVNLLIGELPDSFTMPLDDSASVVGSVMQGDQNYQVIVDSDLEPNDAIEFIRANVGTSGWQEPDIPGGMMGGGGGFVSGPVGAGTMFCLDGNESMMMMISAEKRTPDSPTDLRFNLNNDDQYSPCAEDFDMMGGGPPDIYMIMPTMRSPSGARQIGNGGGGGERNYANTNATLSTSLSLTELVAHYNGEIENSNWQKTGEQIDNTTATSAWSHTNEAGDTYFGLFFAVANENLPEQYTVFFEISQAP